MLAALSLAAALLAPSADAAARRACAPLKPEQRVSQEQKHAVNAALRGSLATRGALSAQSERKVELQLLGEDDLARSWFVYQTCVMKQTGLIDEATAQELVRDLMGLAPPASSAGGDLTTPSGPAAIRVMGRPSTAEVWVDGRPKGHLGAGLVLPVQPGRHKVALKLKGYRTVRATLDVNPGTEERVEVAGMTARTHPAVWFALGLTGAGVVGTGALIGAVAVQTL